MMTRRKRIALGITSLAVALGAGYGIRAAASGIPSVNALTYAGVLEDGSGPVNGTHNIQVFLYDAVTAGNILCQTSSAAVAVTYGHFSVQLPDTCTTAVGANANTWVDVLVDGSDTGRTKIGAVPYAVEAKHATMADTATNANVVTGAIASGLLRVSNACQLNATAYDCSCAAGEIAVSGGGYCGNGVGNNYSLESANPPNGGTTRNQAIWRVSCSSSPPTNYYALCLKTQ